MVQLLYFPSNGGYHELRAYGPGAAVQNEDKICLSVLYRRTNRHVQQGIATWEQPFHWGISGFDAPLAGWRELREGLDRWLKDYEPFAVNIRGKGGHTLGLWVDVRKDKICDRYKPALTVRYSYSSTRLECCYVVDETCVRIAAESLAWIQWGNR